MASVYKKTVTKPLPEGAETFTRKGERFARWKDGKGKLQTAKVTTGRDGSPRIVIETGTFYAKFRDGENIVREVPTGCKTKDGAQSILKELTDRAEKVKANILTAADAAISDHQATPLAKHFAAYLVHQQAKGNSDFYISEAERLATRLCDECGFRLLRDIERGAVEQWLVARQAEGMAARTRNSYVQALNGFCNWCVETRRLAVNPLANVKRADEKSDCRRQRRSMTEGELNRLLYVARCRPLAEYGRSTVRKDKTEVNGKRDTWTLARLTRETIDAAVEQGRERLKDNAAFVAELESRGWERALIYKTLVLTGLRRGELASFTVAHLHLDAEPAFAMLAAADEKNREGSTILLRADLAADLRQWLAHKLATHQDATKQAPTVRLDSEAAKRRQRGTSDTVRFERQSCQQATTLPPDTSLFDVPKQLVKILNRDLQAAGIPKVDERGRSLDVHALRHSFGTLLSKGGVAPRTAQAAMRHSRIDLTMNVYTDPKLLDVHGALDALPALSLDAERTDTQHTVKATGTNDLTASQFAPEFAPTSDNRCKSLSLVDQIVDDDESEDSAASDAASAYVVERKKPLSLVDNGLQQGWTRGLEPPTLRSTI
jgi:integrase